MGDPEWVKATVKVKELVTDSLEGEGVAEGAVVDRQLDTGRRGSRQELLW